MPEQTNQQAPEHRGRAVPSTKGRTLFSLLLLLVSVIYSYFTADTNSKTNLADSLKTVTSKMPDTTSMQLSRAVVKKVEAVETPEGDGATVRRSIGTQSLRNLTPFLMLDHFKIGLGAGFPDHPHRGQTTWTYMLEGYVQHEDFLGNAGVIGPGDLQHMMAAKGMMHAEMPKHFDEQGNRLPDPVGLQLWVDLPADVKSQDPEYQEMSGKDLPTVTPRPDQPVETEGSGWSVKVIAGKSHGVESPVRSPRNGGTWYLDIKLDKPGAKIFQEIPQGWTSFIYTLGPAAIKVGGTSAVSLTSSNIYQAFHTLVLDARPDTNGVWLEHSGAQGEEARLMLYAAQPLDQEVYQYGPFVVSEREHVRKAVSDFQMGINGFEKAPGWKSKIGGL